jgi:tetratricopeptide (TPR) repeat protein
MAAHAPGQTDPGEYFRLALQADRLSLFRYAALGTYLGRQGRFAEVRPILESIQALFDSAEAYRAIDQLYELLGEIDHAIAWTIKARDLEPDNPDHVSRLAALFALIGDEETSLQLEPQPSIGLLYYLRKYDDLISIAEETMIENPDDVEIRYLLAFALVATDKFDQAIHILGSTGLPESVINDQARSTTELEAYQTLINALMASDLPEANKVGLALAGHEEQIWWGDAGWIGLYRGCDYALVGNREKAHANLLLVKQSQRLRRPPELLDMWCFRAYQDDPVYQEVRQDFAARQTALRQRLPTTLSLYGVKL